MTPDASQFLTDLRAMQWWSAAAALFAVVACALLGWLAAYTKRKGEQYATKEDFHELLRQTAETTSVTEQIRSQIEQGGLIGRSELEYRKAQLAEFYGPIYAHLRISTELYGV
jgi:hypothetical protein